MHIPSDVNIKTKEEYLGIWIGHEHFAEGATDYRLPTFRLEKETKQK